MLGTDSKDFVEALVRLEAEAAGDDFLLDLGGAAEDGQSTVGWNGLRRRGRNLLR
jgi:hypothetical protein